MTETSREELDVVSRKLQDQIDQVIRKVSLIPDPFSKLSMLQVRKGGTGAARIRRIPLYSDITQEASVIDTHGNFDLMAHTDFSGTSIDIIYYSGVVIPTDYIAIAGISFNYIFSNPGGTAGTINWVTTVKSIEDTSTAEVVLLSDTNTGTLAPEANTMSLKSIKLTTTPKINTVLLSSLERTATSDTNNSVTSVWAAWLEYVSFI